MKYDLEERTAKYGESIIDANYCEANQASSRKDFQNKIYICKKESNETKYWLQMIAKAYPERKQECQQLWKEAHEFTLIFSKLFQLLKTITLNH
ncbi:four helix bundle protein [Candidatus Gottesmanbacteria bacterium]|nr:four helix bundle protein [Candidatus Gottesmanbacteria bacterium]